MKRWILGLVAGAIGVFLVVGCGGGDDSNTTITKADFTKQASAVCAEGEEELKAAMASYNKKIEATPNGTNSPAFQREAAKVMLNSAMLPSMREELEQLENLGRPAADQEAVSKMVKTFSMAIDSLEENGVQGLLNPEKYVRFQNEAKAYGLDCVPN